MLQKTKKLQIMFIGPPGAGKGTQAERICKRFNLAHISTGDILRAERKAGTPLGVQVQEIIDKGELVPDALVISIVQKRLQQSDCENGFLLDGFPRTIAQAEALSELVVLNAVVSMAVPDEKIADRLCGRRVCRDCGANYHISSIDVDMGCPVCKGALYQRTDDTIETVRERLKIYQSQTQPLIDYYQKKGVVYSVNGDQAIDQVSKELYDVLEQLLS